MCGVRIGAFSCSTGTARKQVYTFFKYLARCAGVQNIADSRDVCRYSVAGSNEGLNQLVIYWSIQMQETRFWFGSTILSNCFDDFWELHCCTKCPEYQGRHVDCEWLQDAVATVSSNVPV